MSEADLLALAERTLGHVDGDAQVTVVHERSLLSRFAESRATQATELDEMDVRVTAVRDGHTATAAANQLGDDALRAAGLRATRAAETAAHAGGPGSYPGLPAPAAPRRPHRGFDPATAELEPAEAGDALRDVFAVAGERGLRAAGIWTAGAVRTAIASSTGLRASDAVTDAYLKVLMRDEAQRSGFAARAATSASGVDATAVARGAAEKVVPGEPTELAPGDYPAVLDADAVGSLSSSWARSPSTGSPTPKAAAPCREVWVRGPRHRRSTWPTRHTSPAPCHGPLTPRASSRHRCP